MGIMGNIFRWSLLEDINSAALSCSKLGSFLTNTQLTNHMVLFHYTVPALLGSTRLDTVPGTTITKRYLLNVGGVVIARLCETAVTSFYTRHKHINNGGYGGDGVLAAVCGFLSHTKQQN